MLESDFNSIVVRSLNQQGGYGYKIPDTFSVYSHQRNTAPYDIFGYYNGKFVCCESKWLQKPQAFNLNRLEDHQITNLIKAYELMRGNGISLFVIGVDYGKGDKRVYRWKNEELYNILDRKNNKQSILKKEFEQNEDYIKIYKGLLNIEELLKNEVSV